MSDRDDLATLAFLDDHTLNLELESRYNDQIIYTYVGDILVAVNPYQQLPELYDAALAAKYNQVSTSSLASLV